MSLRLPLALVALLATALPAAAQDGVQINGWRIADNPANDTCMAHKAANGGSFAIQHAKDPAERFVLFQNPAWTTVANGQPYSATVSIGSSYRETLEVTGVVSDTIRPTVGTNVPAGLPAAFQASGRFSISVPSLGIDVSTTIEEGEKIWSALDSCVNEGS